MSRRTSGLAVSFTGKCARHTVPADLWKAQGLTRGATPRLGCYSGARLQQMIHTATGESAVRQAPRPPSHKRNARMIMVILSIAHLNEPMSGSFSSAKRLAKLIRNQFTNDVQQPTSSKGSEANFCNKVDVESTRLHVCFQNKSKSRPKKKNS